MNARLLILGLVCCGACATVFGQLFRAERVLVRQFHFAGNTVFADAELARVVAPWTGRELAREDLEEARRAVTLHYVERGYINSGAIIPDQPATDGVVTFQIVEGKLTAVELTGNRWLRDRYIRSRLAAWSGPPLNVHQLKEGLQLLRQNPNVKQVNAELLPGAQPGESRLELKVQDARPFRVGLQVDNTRPPTVDSGQVLLLLGHRNLTGHSDALELTYGIAQGGAEGFRFSDADNLAGQYSVPVTRWDTRVGLWGERKNYTVIEAPFQVLDIQTESHRYGLQLRQPLWQRANREIAAAIGFERRHSQTELLGQPFDFPGSGSVNGEVDLSVLRLLWEWTDRSLHHVWAFRSTTSIGLDVLGSTDDGTDRDDKFVAWLGQAQYVRRLFGTQNQLILRADAQWSDGELPALEQFALGGRNTVRGYRENQVVRDRGLLGSIELRLPVVLDRLGAPVVQLAPFCDAGIGKSLGLPGTETILSAGIGLLLNPCRYAHAQLYWGYAFKDFKTPENDPQDLGLHFRITLEAF